MSHVRGCPWKGYFEWDASLAITHNYRREQNKNSFQFEMTYFKGRFWLEALGTSIASSVFW